MWYWSLDLIFKAKLKLESRNQKIQYGHQVAILKMMSLNINRLLPIYRSIGPLKFRVHIQIQTKVRVQKPKNPIQEPGVHFEGNIAENQQATAYGHHQHAFQIWNGNSKQTWLMLRKPCRLESPETEKCNMATGQPFWKWHHWKSLGSYP